MRTGAVSSGKKALKKLLHWAAEIKGAILATPNYGFEKRQKELAKKRKKEEKLKAKSDRKSGLLSEDGSSAEDSGDAHDQSLIREPSDDGNPNPSA
jgi:hypothetical protein